MSPGTTSLERSSSEIPIRNLWYMLLYAWKEARLRDRWATEVESAPNLDALLSGILANVMLQRLRIGLGHDYHHHRSLIRGVRGRVDFPESLRRLAFRHGQASCRFQTYSPNVPKNQIVRSTLARMALVGDFGAHQSDGSELRHRIRRLVHRLDTIDLIELTPENVRREQLHRHDVDYRLMLAICHLLSRRQMPTESAGPETLPGLDRDAMTLYQVFETFVANFYRAHLKDWSVTAQATFRWPAEKHSAYLPVLRPDLVLKHRRSRRIVVLDTKFTAAALTTGWWGKLTFNRDHLFQIYAYLRSQEDREDDFRSAAGVLLYPTVTQAISESVYLQGHQISWETIDLRLPWREIEANLLGLPALRS